MAFFAGVTRQQDQSSTWNSRSHPRTIEAFERRGEIEENQSASQRLIRRARERDRMGKDGRAGGMADLVRKSMEIIDMMTRLNFYNYF